MSHILTDSDTQCNNNNSIGYAPLPYFIFGCFETSITIVLLLILFNRQKFRIMFEITRFIFLLPIYLNMVTMITLIGLLSGINHTIGIYPANALINGIRWFIIRSCTESLSIFLMNSGIGFLTIRNSILKGFTWGGMNVIIILLCNGIFGFLAFNYAMIAVGSTLIIYYAIIIFAPYSYVHRRPAAIPFAILNISVLIAQLVVVIYELLATDYDQLSCSVELTFIVSEFIQLCIIINAFVLDSLFWQGLYSDTTTNLNQPLLGVWDMQDQDTMKIMTDSIVQLERKIVPILPFSRLVVDTTMYFSGGSARVYRGKYDELEVAIKFLFCMELTPERIVEFCHEATLLNSLQHENIVLCYGVAIMPPAISLVTEYCAFGSLFNFLHSSDLQTTPPPAAPGNHNQLQDTTRMSLNSNSTVSYSVQYTTESTTGIRHHLSMNPIITTNTNTNVAAPSTVVTNSNQEKVSGSVSPTNGGELVAVSTNSSGGSSSNTSIASKLVEAISHRYSESSTAAYPPPAITVNHLAPLPYPSSHYTHHQQHPHYNQNNPLQHQHIVPNRIRTTTETDLSQRSNSITTTTGGGNFQSATSVLLSRELGYGLGPSSNSFSIAAAGTGLGYSSSRLSLQSHQANTSSFDAMSGKGGGGVRTSSMNLKRNTMTMVSYTHNQSSVGSYSSIPSIPSYIFSNVSSSLYSIGHTLPVKMKLKLAKECCAGVAYLHSKNILHCDIKSLNFLVSSNLTIKLADLGEARLIHDVDPRKLPRNVNWSSPEILLNTFEALPISSRSAVDVWSLAMVLAEIFTGEVPYDSIQCREMSSNAGVFVNYLRDGARPILPKEYTQYTWLHTMLHSAWDFDPLQRCSAKEMVEIFLNQEQSA